jgi:site-specific recombinase XerD
MSYYKSVSLEPAVASRFVSTHHDSIDRFAELLKLRSLATKTQKEYLRYVRKMASRKKCDVENLSEDEVREHILYLRDNCRYSASSMRSAVAAISAYYRVQLGRDWRLFHLVRSRAPTKLPEVLTREQVSRLFSVVREPRFRVALRLIYACGLRVSEAVKLEVRDVRRDGPRLHLRGTKGSRERFVPLPGWCHRELQAYWRTHRHPRWIFPGIGRGWRDVGEYHDRLASASAPMSIGSLQLCMRMARSEARLPWTTHIHTLRHSYATHLLEEGVSLKLISFYLGHASLETTLVYTHLTPVLEEQARVAIEQLEPKQL